jgi:hypothetical protein
MPRFAFAGGNPALAEDIVGRSFLVWFIGVPLPMATLLAFIFWS